MSSRGRKGKPAKGATVTDVVDVDYEEAEVAVDPYADDTRHPADAVAEYSDPDPLTGYDEGVVAVKGGGHTDGRRARVQQREWSGCKMFPREIYPHIRADAGRPAAIRIQKEIVPGQPKYFHAANAARHFSLDMSIEDVGERWGSGKYILELWSDANSTRSATRLIRRTVEVDASDKFPDGEDKFFPTNGIDDDPSVPEESMGSDYDDYGPPRGRRGRGYGPPDGDDYDPRDPRSRDGWRREREPRGVDVAAVLTAASPVLTAWMANQSAAADRAMQMQMEAIRAQQAAQAESSKQFMAMMMAQNKPAPESRITEVLLTHLLTQKQAPALDPVTAAAQQVAAVDKLRSALGGDEGGGPEGIMGMIGNLMNDPNGRAMVANFLQSLTNGAGGGAPQGPVQAQVQQVVPQPQVHVEHGPPLPPDPQMASGEG